jgi:hypothetical protein
VQYSRCPAGLTTAVACRVRFAPESGHPIFHAALDGCTEFELTHWTGQQLATTYVNRCSQVKEDTLIRG